MYGAIAMMIAEFVGTGRGVPWLAEAVGPAPETSTRWVSVVIALVLVIGIVVACCINPKRGHRD